METRYIGRGGNSTELTKGLDGLWRDSLGTVYGLVDDSSSVDSRSVCGVGWFSLADGNPLNDACAPHDYAYSSPAYQAFHTRQEADFYLEALLKQIHGEEHSVTPELFEFISRELGHEFWENKLTNN